MSMPLWNSIPGFHGELRLPNSELTAPRTGQPDGRGDPGADGGGTGEVEPDDPGAVAPDDQQTELTAAVHSVAFPPRIRPGDRAGPRACHRLVTSVNRRFLRSNPRFLASILDEH